MRLRHLNKTELSNLHHAFPFYRAIKPSDKIPEHIV